MARFVERDDGAENRGAIIGYVQRHGNPLESPDTVAAEAWMMAGRPCESRGRIGRQLVTVTPVDDDIDNDNRRTTISNTASGSGYDGISAAPRPRKTKPKGCAMLLTPRSWRVLERRGERAGHLSNRYIRTVSMPRESA